MLELALSLALLAAPQTSYDLEDGAAAPPDTWYTVGGNAARNGRALTAPLSGKPKQAWRYAPEGVIESEPIVWKDAVFLSVLHEDGRRSIEWIDLESGERVARKVFASSVSLEPAVWESTIALRTSPMTISFFRLGRGSFTRFAEYDSEFPVASPLLFRSESYIVDERSIVRFDPASQDVVWEKAGRFQDRASLRGDSVFVVRREGDVLHLCQLDRSSGKKRREAFVGIPKTVEENVVEEIQLLGNATIVVHENPIKANDGTIFSSSIFIGPRVRTDELRIIKMQVGAVRVGDGWIAYVGDSLDKVTDPNDENYILLASDKAHREFMENVLPLTSVGDVILAGPRAFRADALDILWKLDAKPTFRAVPARDAVLLVVDDCLVAFRGKQPSVPQLHMLFEPPTADAEIVLEDVAVVLRDLAVVDGDISVTRVAAATDKATGIELRMARGKGGPWPLERVVTIVGDDDRLHYAVEGDGLDRALRAVVKHRSAIAHADLAHDSRLCRDPEVMRELLSKARALGSDDERLVKLEKKITQLELKPASKVDEKKIARLREEEEALVRLEARPLWDFARHVDESAPDALRLGLLRRALVDPDTPPDARERAWNVARESLTAADPEFLRKVFERHETENDPIKASQWLDYAAVIERHPVAFIDSAPKESAGMSPAERELGRAMSSWRSDLICATSENLRIMTPLNEPGALARCIDVGEFVCSILSDIFASKGTNQREKEPLLLNLYADQEEYLKEARERGGAFGTTAASFTAGYYSPEENRQHIFLPSGEEGFDSIVGTYAHELTHNWIRMQCPLFTLEESEQRRVTTPGYWIVEGFATFVDEFEFDLATGTAEPWNATARSLDVLANAAPTQRIPWAKFFGMTQVEFQTLTADDVRAVPLTWKIGARFQMSEARMFYEQGGAVCRYLYFADDGKHRDALLDYIRAHYTGSAPELSTRAAFGLDDDALGAAVVEYARATIGR